ncbi:MAG: GNAT family N-acetyltransferase, partial [Phycisphaerae bacterium]
MIVRRARAPECADVLRLSFASPHRSAADTRTQAEAFRAYASVLRLDLSRQWVVSDGSRLLTGCTCVESPGRLAILVCPPPPDAQRLHPAFGRMLQALIEAQAARDTRIIQCLLEPNDDAPTAHCLAENGFIRLARLNYMEARADAAGPDPIPDQDAAEMHWQTYEKSAAPRFRDTIAKTYQGSQDCPMLSQFRTPDDAMASHHAAGVFRPHRWQLLVQRGAPIGCVLLNETPLRAALEVVYMGLIPEARGRGMGNLLMDRAFQLARNDGFRTMSLAVDAT